MSTKTNCKGKKKLTAQQKRLLNRIDFLKQMVRQLSTDLAFGYIYQQDYIEKMKEVNAQIDEIEDELFDRAVHRAIEEVQP